MGGASAPQGDLEIAPPSPATRRGNTTEGPPAKRQLSWMLQPAFFLLSILILLVIFWDQDQDHEREIGKRPPPPAVIDRRYSNFV